MLGAEEFGFGKMLLVAEGCIMARICQKNTCPRGIATHDPKFKKKYRGNADKVETLLHYLAEDVRRHVSILGFTHLDEVVGRADLLRVAERHRERVRDRGLDLALLQAERPHTRGFRGNLLREGMSRINQRLLEDAEPALLRGERIQAHHEIRSPDRAVLATLSGAIARREHEAHLAGLAGRPALHPGVAEGAIRFSFTGSAGQGFAAFLTTGQDILLEGEANDSVAKSMSGGRVVIRPSPQASFAPEKNAIIGNAALYGATGGTLFVHGLAGDRFAVRNSGAQAVVEGTGLHACEYMTGGLVVILGEVSTNVGAGMTGGQLFLPRVQALHVNRESLEMHELDSEDRARLKSILEDYVQATGSRTALSVLEGDGLETTFVCWRPKAARPVLRAVSG